MRSRFRGISTRIAWLCMALYLGALTHGIVIQHSRCVEHGDIVHTGNTHHVTHTNTQHALLPEASDPEHDEHCALAVLLRNAFMGSSASGVVLSGIYATAGPHIAQCDLVQIPLTILAPKNSPPA